MRSALEPLLAVGSTRNCRNRVNQSAMFMLLARLNRAHHQATGFDGCRHSNLMYRSACDRIDIQPSRYCHEARPLARGMCEEMLLGGYGTAGSCPAALRSNHGQASISLVTA